MSNPTQTDISHMMEFLTIQSQKSLDLPAEPGPLTETCSTPCQTDMSHLMQRLTIEHKQPMVIPAALRPIALGMPVDKTLISVSCECTQTDNTKQVDSHQQTEEEVAYRKLKTAATFIEKNCTRSEQQRFGNLMALCEKNWKADTKR